MSQAFDVIVSRPGFNHYERIGYGVSAAELGNFLSQHPERSWLLHAHPSFWEDSSFPAGDCKEDKKA